MIVAERKPIEKIEEMVAPYPKVLVVGCGTCVAVCLAGGDKEVQILAEELRLKARAEGRDQVFDEVTLTRQCDREYLDLIAARVDDYDALLSTACGAGVQYLAERYDTTRVLPALDTRFIGVALGAGEWQQRCIACADCVLDQTGGICPKTMCAKGLVNGPCGGTNHGKCEVNPDTDCAWTLIYNRLKKQNRLDLMRNIAPMKRHKPSTHPARFHHMAYKRLDGEF
jgi:ferredoxin